MNKIGLKNAECVCNYRLRPDPDYLLFTSDLAYFLLAVFGISEYCILFNCPDPDYLLFTSDLAYFLLAVFGILVYFLVYCILSFEFP